jgi:hypothetical protein
MHDIEFPDSQITATNPTAPAQTSELLVCNRCGRSSTWREAFVGPHNHGARKSICPHCRSVTALKKSRTKIIATVLIATLVPIASLFGYEDNIFWYAAAWSWFYLMLYASLFPHELGHALVARWLACPPIAIAIGEPPWKTNIQALGNRWLIGQGLGNACTLIDPRGERFLRLRLLLLTLAGPLASAAVSAAAFAITGLIPGDLSESIAKPAFALIGIANAFVALLNFWPHRVTTPVGTVGSDGMQILKYLIRKLENPQKIFDAATAMRAYLAHQDGDYPGALQETEKAIASFGSQPEFAVLKSAILCGLERPAEVQAMLREALQKPDLPPQVRAIAANNLAWSQFMLNQPALLEEALSFSQQALRILPWMPAVVVTRACVLAAAATPINSLGNEARKTLEGARDLDLEPRSQACAALALGLIEAAAGNGAKAQAHLERAKMLGIGVLVALVLEKRLLSNATVTEH